jgi:hypothetical protein
MSHWKWGLLVLSREGADKEANIPESISLYDEQQFVGRLPNADSNKYRHSQQCVISSPYLSSTHFSIEMKPPVEGSTETTFFVADYSRNGTLVRTKKAKNDSIINEPKLVGCDNRLQISSGDEIILKFRDEIKLVYTFVANIPDSQTGVIRLSDSNSSRKRSKNGEIKDDGGGEEGGVEGGDGVEINNSLQLQQQVVSLQESLRSMEAKGAAMVLAIDDLTKDLSNKDKKLEEVQKKLADKRDEHINAIDTLCAKESDLNATKARLSNMTDSKEELKAENFQLKSKN